MSDRPSVIQIKKPLSFSEKFRSKNAPTSAGLKHC